MKSSGKRTAGRGRTHKCVNGKPSLSLSLSVSPSAHIHVYFTLVMFSILKKYDKGIRNTVKRYSDPPKAIHMEFHFCAHGFWSSLVCSETLFGRASIWHMMAVSCAFAFFIDELSKLGIMRSNYNDRRVPSRHLLQDVNHCKSHLCVNSPVGFCHLTANGPFLQFLHRFHRSRFRCFRSCGVASRSCFNRCAFDTRLVGSGRICASGLSGRVWMVLKYESPTRPFLD